MSLGVITLRVQREKIFQATGRFVLPKVCVFFPNYASWLDGRSHPSLQPCLRKVSINCIR